MGGAGIDDPGRGPSRRSVLRRAWGWSALGPLLGSLTGRASFGAPARRPTAASPTPTHRVETCSNNECPKYAMGFAGGMYNYLTGHCPTETPRHFSLSFATQVNTTCSPP